VTWSWRYQDAQGQDLPAAPEAAPVESFATKGDAESWLGEAWRDLLAAGVEQVVLVEGDRVEYAMPLTPADLG
jgi:hypothetical protein